MDFNLYKASSKDTTVPRPGVTFNYRYFFSPAAEGKPTVLFLHGFPSNGYECWRHQAAFFVDLGFGVLIPDLLGYGGTSKPQEVEAYAKSLMAGDIISILEKENLQGKGTRIYAIGHDWGCALTSGLATFHPDRFAGFAFLSFGYLKPNPNFKIAEFYKNYAAIAGYDECFGYWEFFKTPKAAETIEAHMDAFLSLLYPKDPITWKTNMAPEGKLQEWVESDTKTDPLSSLKPEDFERQKAELLKGGMTGPLNWYKQYALEEVAKDDKLVPPENYTIKKPVFFAATSLDYICVPNGSSAFMDASTCPTLTRKTYETDHWVQLAEGARDILNRDLLAWIKEFEVRQ
ncbi:Alpha/Beta hydrolase protein [Mycena metata]|uniref:Alpha/Beta hydrolase protein n=1 Tax=Mycena metata TaxID=1033252 RepID=A0AAD7MSS6_9AGAR|nr:Alpha/Beta hydrolase protein [Mycena metata]